MDIRKKTKKQLYELARQFKLPNRSKMDKNSLIKALTPILSSSTRLPTMSSTALSGKSYLPKGKNIKEPSADNLLSATQNSNIYPIPEYYERDFITLMPVDPSNTYACWELSSSTKEKYQTEKNIASPYILLKLCMDNKGETAFLEDLRIGQVGSYFFHHYLPNKECWVEMGISDEKGQYSPIMASRRIIVPDEHIHETGELKSMTVEKSPQGVILLSRQTPMKVHGKPLDTKWKTLNYSKLSRRQK